MADAPSVTENTAELGKQDDPMKNYEFDGQTYIYTDKATNITYKFDQENNKWIVKEDNKMSTDSKKNSDETEKKEICNKVVPPLRLKKVVREGMIFLYIQYLVNIFRNE